MEFSEALLGRLPCPLLCPGFSFRGFCDRIRGVGQRRVRGKTMHEVRILSKQTNGLRLQSGSFIPLWLSMGANAYWVILFKNYFESLPKDFIDAARLDGCSDFRVFTRIILPLSRPILVVVAIFAICAAWSDFLMPYLLLGGTDKETVMVKLFSFQNSIKTNQTDIIRAVLYSVIPPTILFALFQKQIMGGVMSGGIKE